jgi:hypothetical protein
VDYSDPFDIALAASVLLPLALLNTGRAAVITGRHVRVLPARFAARGPADFPPDARLQAVRNYVLLGLGPQLMLFLIVVYPGASIPLPSRAFIAAELLVVALWVAYLARLPVTSGGRPRRHAKANHAASGAGPSTMGADPATRRGVGLALAVVGGLLVATSMFAIAQLGGFEPNVVRAAVPEALMGAIMVAYGLRMAFRGRG